MDNHHAHSSMEKALEAGFDNATKMEEGRSPTTTEHTLVALDSSMQSTSQTNNCAATTASSIFPLMSSLKWKSIRPNTSTSRSERRVDKLESFPLGYSRVACLMNSDISFSMYRRYGVLHARLLLHKQDKLRELEEELQRRDKKDNELEETQIYLKCREEADDQDTPDVGRSRQEIMAEIEKVILEYGTLLGQAQRLEAMEKPTDRDHTSVTNYFNMEAPFVEADRDFLLHKDDLVTTRPGRDHAWLDAAVESALRWYPHGPVKYMFCDEATRLKTDNQKIHYFSRTRINFFVTLIITILILVLLVVPIGVLFYLSLNEASGAGEFVIIGVLMICTLVFSCVLSLFTKAKRHELLAASAGYAAVLVVFVGNVGNNISKTGP